MDNTLADLVKHLEKKGLLKTPVIREALLAVDRKNFVAPGEEEYAYADSALLLADGQTISQPSTVVFMLELLNVQKGNAILDVGAGSGWVSCLMGHLTGESGKIYAYEVNQTVGALGYASVVANGCKNVEYLVADASKEWQKYAPYDRIYSGAAFDRIPEDLKRLLAVGGILVAPTQDGYINKITRKRDTEYEVEEFYGFLFVPFVKKG